MSGLTELELREQRETREAAWAIVRNGRELRRDAGGVRVVEWARAWLGLEELRVENRRRRR